MYPAAHARDRCIVVIDGDDEVMQHYPTAMNSRASQTHAPGEDCREHQPAHHLIEPERQPQPISQTSAVKSRPQLPPINRPDYLAPNKKFPPPESDSSSARNASFITPDNHNRLTNGRETSGIPLTPTSTSSRTQNLRLPQPPVIYDVTDDDDFMDANEVSAWVAQHNEDEARRLSASSSTSKMSTRRKSSVILPRNGSITAPFASLDEFDHNGIRLAPRVYVELREGDFMKIVHIVSDTRTSEITLRGFIFRRTREMNGFLDRKLNEVCWIIHIDDDDPRDHDIQGLETVSVTEVVKRRKIRLTNLSFPALSFRDDKHEDMEGTVENDRVLVCRYKYICCYPDAKARKLNAWCEKGLHRLRADDCDKWTDNNIKDEDLRTIWRGETSPGGAQEGWMVGEREFLRQEAVSNKGVISRQSLKIAGGTYFPPGDPMKRGGVGTLLRTMTPSAAISANTAPHPAVNSDENLDASLVVASDADDEVEEAASSSSSSTRAQQQRSHRRKPRLSLAALDKWLDPSDHDSDETQGITHAINRMLRESSVKAQRSTRTSPRIVEFDTQVRTISRSGIYEKRYEGKITETYIPKPGALNKKRRAEHSFGSSVGPRKRVAMGLRNNTNHRIMTDARKDPIARYRPRSSLYKLHEVSPSDSDKTLGRSQSEDSVEEMCTPTKARGYGITRSGLPTPLSLRRNSSIRPMFPSNTDLALPFRHPRPSTPSFGQERLILGDKDNVIDLTRAQPRQQSALSTQAPRSSISRQPSICASLQSPPDHPTNTYETSSAPYASSRPRLSYNGGFSNDQRRPSLARVPLPTSSCGSRVQSHRHSPRASVSPARLSSRATDDSQVQSQSTALPQAPVEQECQKPLKEIQRRYTFGDCFCGAGGMSRGAINAGLRIKWGFDFNLSACQTYALNFVGTSVYNVWANDFSEAKGDHRVDICHLSPPCQYFSDAHTWEGKDDEMNTASLFAIFNLLEKAKPRVVTLEQTSGLIRRHPIFFNAVINMFTSRGFSVRWRILNCTDFGLPQRRMRLFLIASCPGEALPPFPKPTHSAQPNKTGLKPWTTINEAIGKIPNGWANHDVDLARERDASPQSGDKISTCITTNGGNIIHPSGKRDYTHREFACLQSFPFAHKFGGSGVKKQIGNAVPPVLATVVLEEVKRALLKADGLL